jgi:hypothetical protein
VFQQVPTGKEFERAANVANDIMTRHDLPLSQINNNALWLGLCLVGHPRYNEFISQCPAFEVVKLPEGAIYVSSRGCACFDSFMEAYNFLKVFSRCKNTIVSTLNDKR